MNFHRKITLLSYLFATLLFSCKKDIDIPVPGQPPGLVVNCLFNPDSSWKVFVGAGMPLDDTAMTSIVENADVTLYEAGHPIPLTYRGGGYYVSGLKPEAGVKYTLKAKAPGFPAVEASDSIPAKLTVASHIFDTIPIVITKPDIRDNEKMNKLILSIDGFSDKSYAQVNVRSYPEYNLYYYTITNSTLDQVRRELEGSGGSYPGFDISSVISRLAALKDKPVLSWINLMNKINDALGPVPGEVYTAVFKHAERKPTQKHVESLFIPLLIDAPQPPFYNIYDKTDYTVFAEGKNASGSNRSLFYTDGYLFDQPGPTKIYREIWVDLVSLSEAAYRFETTLIKQNLSQGDLFREPVQVYNNIKGGQGIFAGYQRESIRIY